MRRVLVVIGLLVLAAAAWFFLADPSGSVDHDGRQSSADPAAAAPVAKETARTPRKRSAEEIREEAVSEFQRLWPEIGQDRPQDPKLGAIKGVALKAPDVPLTDGVVETAVRGEVTARARVQKTGEFLVKNVPPGRGISLTVRATDYAPGGVNRLLLLPGETLDVHAIYLGAAFDPDTTDRMEVHVVKSAAAGGGPVAGARVTATSTLYGALIALGAWEKQPGGTVVRATTDDKGVAVFDKLPPQSYDFFSEADGLTFDVEQRYLVQKDTQATVTLELDVAQSIEGKVVDAEGKPVAGAHLGAFRMQNFTMNPAVNSDDEGKFRIPGLAGGKYMIFAFKEGAGEKDTQGVDGNAKDVTIELKPGAEMVLKVTDAATGAPVKAFGVRPFRQQPFAYLFSPLVDVTAEDGIFHHDLPPQSWGVEVTAKGYAQKSIPAVPVPTKEPFEVKLEKAGVVHGRVVAKDGGRIVRGAKVFVKRGGLPPSPVKDLQTVTGEDGTFVLDGLARSALTIWVSHVDHSDQSFTVTPEGRTPDNALPPVQDFELSGGGRIAGHVFGADGKPLAGESVVIMKGAMDFLTMRNVVVAADGAYEFRNVPPETYRVSVGGGFGGNAKTGVVVTDGGVVTVDFGAESGGQRLAGKLVKEDGSPVADAAVFLDDGSGQTKQTQTDTAGRFAFEKVPPGRSSVRAWGRSKVVDVVVKADEPPAEVVLTVVSGSIEGRVIDATTGQPLSGAWVDLEQSADAGGNASGQTLRSRRGARPNDADGTFRFTSLDEGTYCVRAQRDPYGSEMVEGVVLAVGEKKTGVEIRLAPGAGTLTGVVKTAAGAPIEGAALDVRTREGRHVFSISLATSSSDGTFTQGQIKPGEYDVTMEKDGFAPSTQRVVVEASKPARADFTLLQGGRIEVTGRLYGGDPAKSVSVSLLDARGQRVEKSLTLANIFSAAQPKTDANGQITVRGVAAGSYTVRLSADDGAEATGTVNVVEGASAAVEIVFPAK